MLALLCAGLLIPQSAPIGEAKARVKDPLTDATASEEVRLGYRIFEHTPASLQHDGVIIDDQNRGHGEPLA